MGSKRPALPRRAPGEITIPLRWPLAILLVTAAALAAPPPLPPAAAIRDAYRQLDTTGNGAVGLKEWQAASRALFAATDKNHDGVIERAELGANALIREAFPDAAAGAEGKLPRDRFHALRDTIFRAADIDRNDYITLVEYELLVLLRRTGWRDRNDDGRIAMSELREILARAFALLDADRDGTLTAAESAFLAPAHLAATDPKKTGRITLEQLINGYRFLLGADQVNRNVVPRAFPLHP